MSKVQLAGASGTDKNQGPDEATTSATPPMQAGEIPSAAYIKKLWTRGIERRRFVDREAWENIAFIGGHHYAVWDGNTHRFMIPDPRQDRQLRMKVNLLKDIWRGEIANMTAGMVQPIVTPVTAEDRDKQIALVAQRVLDHEFHRLKFPSRRVELATWVTSAGLAYVHPWWNPDDGPNGNVTLDIVPHFEVVPDPACRFSLQEGQYAIHGRILTQEEAFERFGKNYAPESDQQPFNWSTLFQGGSFNTNSPQKRGVLVLRMWHKPSRKYPDGFVVTAINGQIVEQITPYPYTHGLLPFVDFHHIKLPGRFEGQSVLTDLVPLQRDYNQSRSRMAELRRLFVGARWLSPEGSLRTDRFTGLPNENVEYVVNSPYKPEPLPIPNVPNFIFQTTQVTRQEMQDIAGVHEHPEGASGAAALALKERDNAKLSASLMLQEQGFESLGEQVLGLVHQYWQEPRMVRTWNEELDESGIDYFEGADIEGQYSVTIRPGSSMPTSKVQTANDLMQLWERKVITDSSVVIKGMQLPNSDQLIDNLSIDTRQAKREHDRLYKLVDENAVVAEFWHNHEAHIAEHNRFRKTETFENWDPALQAMLADHVEQHYQMYMQQRQATIQLVTDEYVSAETQQTAAYIQAQQQMGLPGVPPEGRQYISAPPLQNLQPITPIQQENIPPK